MFQWDKWADVRVGVPDGQVPPIRIVPASASALVDRHRQVYVVIHGRIIGPSQGIVAAAVAADELAPVAAEPDIVQHVECPLGPPTHGSFCDDWDRRVEAFIVVSNCAFPVDRLNGIYPLLVLFIVVRSVLEEGRLVEVPSPTRIRRRGNCILVVVIGRIRKKPVRKSWRVRVSDVFDPGSVFLHEQVPAPGDAETFNVECVA